MISLLLTKEKPDSDLETRKIPRSLCFLQRKNLIPILKQEKFHDRLLLTKEKPDFDLRNQ
jgi:hypothetical protein